MLVYIYVEKSLRNLTLSGSFTLSRFINICGCSMHTIADLSGNAVATATAVIAAVIAGAFSIIIRSTVFDSGDRRKLFDSFMVPRAVCVSNGV